jgi:hypothetical protein
MASRPRMSRPRLSRPRVRRPRVSRLLRTILAALVGASVAGPVAGAARAAAVPAPVPVAWSPLRDASPSALALRYAAGRDGILAAERVAAAHGDRRRAAALAGMAVPERRFLFFDGRDGGRTAEVFGDLSRAERVAVLVPGSDTNLDKYGMFRAGASRLRQALGDGAAVIAWLGYATPSTLSTEVLTASPADRAAPALRAFVRDLRAAVPAARVSVLCHSYGSVVCARAASGLDVADLVLYGSAGVGVDTAAALGTRATVWAGRGGSDWIAHVPHERLRLPFATLGFGADPVSKRFGARVFAAGGGGHSDYLRPGPALENLAAIISGRLPSGEGHHA